MATRLLTWSAALIVSGLAMVFLLAGAARAQDATGDWNGTVTELPGLNHLFQTAKTGAAGEYADIEETVAPIALDTVSAWIVKHTR